MPDTNSDDLDLSAIAADASGGIQLLTGVLFLYVFMKLVGLVANALEAAPALGFSTPLDDVTETVTAPVDAVVKKIADWSVN